MEKLLNELRDRFDVVILDAPPLLPVTDAALLAAEADGALVVVRHGQTTADQLTHSLERLAAVDAKPLGVVINQAPRQEVRSWLRVRVRLRERRSARQRRVSAARAGRTSARYTKAAIVKARWIRLSGEVNSSS